MSNYRHIMKLEIQLIEWKVGEGSFQKYMIGSMQWLPRKSRRAKVKVMGSIKKDTKQNFKKVIFFPMFQILSRSLIDTT